jgi:hypothetical protein
MFMISLRSLSAPPPQQLLDRLADFHEIQHKHCATRGDPTAVPFNVLQFEIARWRICLTCEVEEKYRHFKEYYLPGI